MSDQHTLKDEPLGAFCKTIVGRPKLAGSSTCSIKIFVQLKLVWEGLKM